MLQLAVADNVADRAHPADWRVDTGPVAVLLAPGNHKIDSPVAATIFVFILVSPLDITGAEAIEIKVSPHRVVIVAGVCPRPDLERASASLDLVVGFALVVDKVATSSENVVPVRHLILPRRKGRYRLEIKGIHLV